MKTMFLMIIGVILFLIGISVLAYEIYGNSDFRLNVETELLLVFGLIVPGMVFSGTGVVLEFAKREWI